MRQVFVRSAYNYDADQVSVDGALHCGDDVDRCQQHFKEEVDINTIVRRFGLTGQLPDNYRAPLVGDFVGVSDFQTAMNAVVEAQRAFMEMPGELRKRFGHDPQLLMEFLADDKNRDEAVRLGLVAKPLEKTRDAVAAIDDLAKQLVPRETK